MKKKHKILCGYQGRANYGKYGRYLAVKNKGHKFDAKKEDAE